MPQTTQVHWHEGLFLLPHHMQMLQRQGAEQRTFDRRLAFDYPYGVIEARLSPDALANHVVQFDTLRAVMPSGLEVHFPDNADLPALNVERAFNDDAEPFVVALAVPLWQGSGANTLDAATTGAAGSGNGSGDGYRVNRLFKVAEVQRPDENSGRNAKVVQVRRLNARLVLGRDDTTDVEVLPLLRIVHGTSEETGAPRVDPRFAGPSLVLSGSRVLVEMIRDLANYLEARRRELVGLITRGGFSIETLRGEQFGQMIRLRIYNHYAGRLPALLRAPATTPFQMYLELRGLVGEMSSLYPDRQALFDVSPYDHNNPVRSFEELCAKARNTLHGAKPKRAELKFTREGRRHFVTLGEDDLSRPIEYYLAVRTAKQDAASLGKLVEDPNRFKLMPRGEIDLSVYGIPLEHERYPLPQLPAEAGLHYFRLNRSAAGRMWDKVRQQRAMAATWPGAEASDFSLSLWMTLPEDEGGPAATPTGTAPRS